MATNMPVRIAMLRAIGVKSFGDLSGEELAFVSFMSLIT
jgi:hypothetical protein